MTAIPSESLAGVVRRLRLNLDERLVAEVARLETEGRHPSRDDQRALAGALAQDWLASLAGDRARSGQPLLARHEEEVLARAALDALFGAGPLQPFIDDLAAREVRVNSDGASFVVRTDGTKVEVPPIFAGPDELVETVRNLARQVSDGAGGERRFDPAHPVLDLQLQTGHRLWAVMSVTPGPCLVVRCADFGDLTRLDVLAERGMFRPLVGALLRAAVRGKFNMALSGGTGLGKTTLLRACCNEIPSGERLLVIEDSPELGLDRLPDAHPDLVPMCRREDNVEGTGGVPLPDLVRSAVRGSPDRLVVGEVRGHEVLPWLLAATVGNEGSMTTVHARSSAEVFSRLALFAALSPEAVPFHASAALIAGAVDLAVHLAPRPATAPGDSPGVVASVREVVGHRDGAVVANEVLRPGLDGTVLPGAPFRPETLERLEAAGFPPDALCGEEPW
jgi:Flp pilus assembly CpaF family ATPase